MAPHEGDPGINDKMTGRRENSRQKYPVWNIKKIRGKGLELKIMIEKEGEKEKKESFSTESGFKFKTYVNYLSI